MAFDAIILAAGKGKRMQSDLPKVVHAAAGKPMVQWVAEACFSAGAGRVVLVVGHGREHVESVFANHPERGRIEYALQEQQLGTGDAVKASAGAFSAGGAEDVLVLCGDGPLIRAETLGVLIDRHRTARASATMATAVLDDPTGYGRIIRDGAGRFERIVEQKNASEAERAVREVNPSYYCFAAGKLFAALDDVRRDEVTGEYYLTDVPGLMMARGECVEVVDAVPAEDVLSVNTPEQLAAVERVLVSRNEAEGVRL